MKIVTFNVQEIEIDAIQAVDTMAFTYTEIQRIRMQVTILYPKNICNCTKAGVEIFAQKF